MHCQQGGEVWAWNGLLHAFRRFLSGFELFLSSGGFPGGIDLTGEGHRSDLCSSQVLGDFAQRSDRWGWSVWPMRAELMQLLCFMRWFGCIRPGGVALVQGEHFVVFELGWWFSLFAWAWFYLRCVEPLPLPKRSETCLLQVIFLFDFLWLSIVCWSFFLFVSFLFLFSRVMIEDNVWFEDRWMVASWCDEWLTTLCGLILG
jgi:hypothetical protein